MHRNKKKKKIKVTNNWSLEDNTVTKFANEGSFKIINYIFI
jgi:hypothetical protein